MKKVLVISFDSFNISGSNGRSLGSILKLLDNELSISQIYIKGPRPDFVKGKYCLIEEGKLTRNIFSVKKCISTFELEEECANESSNQHPSFGNGKVKKTLFKMLCRNVLWSFASLQLKKVYQWAEEIRPDYVLVTCGDLPILNKLAYKIAAKNNAKLLFYSTENYPLKKKNYISKRKSLLYYLLQKKLFRSCKKIVENSSANIYLTDSLKKEFDENYKAKGESFVIRPYSILEPLESKSRTEEITFSYCGNLGLKRLDTLLDIADSLEENLPHSKLIICGKTTDENLNRIKSKNNVSFLGQIPYENVLGIYKKSDFILHVEGFDEFLEEDVKHAFSGKIGDCISSTRPFIFVGPNSSAESLFLKETKSAFVFDSVRDFQSAIIEGTLLSSSFDQQHQIEVKNKYFSKSTLILSLKNVFNLL